LMGSWNDSRILLIFFDAGCSFAIFLSQAKKIKARMEGSSFIILKRKKPVYGFCFKIKIKQHVVSKQLRRGFK
jgi:hypothetical protein